VRSFNALLFQFANDLNEVAKLRSQVRHLKHLLFYSNISSLLLFQLKYMNAYLTTCTGRGNKTKEAFLRLISPRFYIHESVEMYSIKDLEDIKTGKINLLNSSVACKTLFNFRKTQKPSWPGITDLP